MITLITASLDICDKDMLVKCLEKLMGTVDQVNPLT